MDVGKTTTESFEGKEDVLDELDPLKSLKPHPKLLRFPRPDTSLMVPFKPEAQHTVAVASHPTIAQFGSVLPESLIQFVLALPLPSTYQGICGTSPT